MKKEVEEKCDLCGKITYCVYFEDWGVWICNICYWSNNMRMKEYFNLIL